MASSVGIRIGTVTVVGSVAVRVGSVVASEVVVVVCLVAVGISGVGSRLVGGLDVRLGHVIIVLREAVGVGVVAAVLLIVVRVGIVIVVMIGVAGAVLKMIVGVSGGNNLLLGPLLQLIIPVITPSHGYGACEDELKHQHIHKSVERLLQKLNLDFRSEIVY